MGFHSPPLPPRSEFSDRIPTPLAIAGIGMLLAAMMPDRLTVGQGFWYGLLIGFVLVAVVALLGSRSDSPPTKYGSQPESRSDEEFASEPESGFDYPAAEYAPAPPEPAPPRPTARRRKARENNLKDH
jgi:hypothetical protein